MQSTGIYFASFFYAISGKALILCLCRCNMLLKVAESGADWHICGAKW